MNSIASSYTFHVRDLQLSTVVKSAPSIPIVLSDDGTSLAGKASTPCECL